MDFGFWILDFKINANNLVIGHWSLVIGQRTKDKGQMTAVTSHLYSLGKKTPQFLSQFDTLA
nr:hypothetical protein [Nostoc sp. EkiNYC01]